MSPVIRDYHLRLAAAMGTVEILTSREYELMRAARRARKARKAAVSLSYNAEGAPAMKKEEV